MAELCKTSTCEHGLEHVHPKKVDSRKATVRASTKLKHFLTFSGTGSVGAQLIFSNVVYSTCRTIARLRRAPFCFASGAEHSKEIFVYGAFHARDGLQEMVRSIHERLGSRSRDSTKRLRNGLLINQTCTHFLSSRSSPNTN